MSILVVRIALKEKRSESLLLSANTAGANLIPDSCASGSNKHLYHYLDRYGALKTGCIRDQSDEPEL